MMVTFVFPVRGGKTGEADMAWTAGRSIKSYFKDPLLKPYGLIAKRLRHTLINHDTRERLRLTSVPGPGDVILMTRV